MPFPSAYTVLVKEDGGYVIHTRADGQRKTIVDKA